MHVEVSLITIHGVTAVFVGMDLAVDQSLASSMCNSQIL